MASRMYEGVKSWNPFVGCEFNCVYCQKSFQRQAKRWKKWCQLCYEYKPHFHEERLKKVPKADTVFISAFGDISFIDLNDLYKIFDVVENVYWDRIFYLQTKNPSFFDFVNSTLGFPDNVLLGITLETDMDFYSTPSKYTSYHQISHAPSPTERLDTIKKQSYRFCDFITIEPILDFSSPKQFAKVIRQCRPRFVYVGYDNHGCKLPEPPLGKTQELIEELEKFTEVRLKTIRPAWWEHEVA